MAAGEGGKVTLEGGVFKGQEMKGHTPGWANEPAGFNNWQLLKDGARMLLSSLISALIQV